MGKKTKKTKWRTLEIPSSPGKHYEFSGSKWENGYRTPGGYQLYEKSTRRKPSSTSSSAVPLSKPTYPSKEETKRLVEDEYTKITTPRQDVLFKKGYLTRRKIPETISENSADQNSDGIAQDCSNNEDFSNYGNDNETVQQFMCPDPQSYIDPSTLYYGSGYEVYDPYMGNVTLIVGPGAGQYPSNSSCQPILTSVPCRPVPLQPVQWFNPLPSPDWCCPYSSQSDKRCSTDSQNGSGMGSESSGVPESPSEVIEEPFNGNNPPVFSPSYMYPGYMFGAPIYNIDDLNVQYYAPESPALSTSELITSKKRKKKKRRRRTAETEEESESSLDDNCNHSVSSTECTLDSQSQTGFQEYEDDLKNQSALAVSHYSSLPHGNVNAPEFVPADLSLSSLSTSIRGSDSVTVQSTNGICSSITANTVVDNDKHSTENFSKNSVGLNVHCKPFDSRDNKHDSESVSCSTNSDSGISSPSSEDISKVDFHGEQSRGQNEENKKKPRSKKSNKAKNKSEETKPADCSQAVRISNKNIKPVPRKDSKKNQSCQEENESKTEYPSCILKKEVHNGGKKTKIEPFVPPKNKSDKKKETRKKETRRGEQCEQPKKRTTCNRFEGKSQNKVKYSPLIETTSVISDCNSDVIEEPNNNNIVIDSKLEEFVVCNGCPDGSINDRYQTKNDDQANVNVNTLSSSQSEATTTRDKISEIDQAMLNEYLQIEKKPMLAKLVDLAELAEDTSNSVVEEISSISEYSSCREKQPADVLTRQEKRTLESIQPLAKEVVNDIIECAERRILSSMSCDKLQLPITQAVTKWLNEHGGLPAAVTISEDSLHNSENDFDLFDEGAKTIKANTKSKKLKQNCVIC